MVLLLSATTLPSNAQITQAVADSIVTMNTMSQNSYSVVYRKNGVVNKSERVFTMDAKIINHNNESSYIYFVDDMPMANWAHECRYFIVDAITGEYSVENKMWYPEDFESFTKVITEDDDTDRWHWPYNNYTIPDKAEPNMNLYAVLIGGSSGTHSPVKTWYNLSCVYTALVNSYGYIEASDENPTHIFVLAHDAARASVYDYVNNSDLYPYCYDLNHSGGISPLEWENDFIDPDTLAYSKDGIRTIFENLAGTNSPSEDVSYIPQLTEEDQLFVLLCGHGIKENGMSYFRVVDDKDNDARLYDYELAEWTRNINCSQITFMIDCCYSGGFVDNLMEDTSAVCKNRAVHTCTNDTTYGYVEEHITSQFYNKELSDNQRVDEFIYYWSAASLGYYPILDIRYDSILGPWHRYDSTAIGQFPWRLISSFKEGEVYSHDLYDISPDINRDGTVSMGEAFLFADNLDSYSPNGYFNPINLKDLAYIEYPCQSYESSFSEALLTLDGYRGFVRTNVETGGFNTYNMSGNILIGEDASVTLNDGCVINGNGFEFANRGGLIETGTDAGNVVFNDVHIVNRDGLGLSLSNCTFNSCGTIVSYDSPFSISSSNLNSTTIEANTDNPNRGRYSVNIIGNSFNNLAVATPSIYFRKIPRFNVVDNTIHSGGDAVELWYLGGTTTDYVFSDNIISGCNGSGIVSYSSSAVLSNNYINDNMGCGIKSLNLSNLQLVGDSTAVSLGSTQQICNNGIYQVFASGNSYPSYFKFNNMRGNGGDNDYILYYESGSQRTNSLLFDVSSNCWYPLANNEIPAHLYTNGGDTFHYLPTWQPSSIIGTPNPEQRMLSLAGEYASAGEYVLAMDTYRDLVDTYPETSEAVTAMREMFSLVTIFEGDFMELKSYFLQLQNSNALGVLADNLSNKCNEKLKRYNEAIAWYENVIADGEASLSDKVFAEIDLGELYLEMDRDGDRGIPCTLNQYIPQSKELHTSRSRHLVSLLPNMDNPNDGGYQEYAMANNYILSCLPNPVTDILEISFDGGITSSIDVSICNINGEELICKSFVDINNSPCIKLDLSYLPDGMYFCKLMSGFEESHVKKIIVKH